MKAESGVRGRPKGEKTEALTIRCAAHVAAAFRCYCAGRDFGSGLSALLDLVAAGGVAEKTPAKPVEGARSVILPESMVTLPSTAPTNLATPQFRKGGKL